MRLHAAAVVGLLLLVACAPAEQSFQPDAAVKSTLADNAFVTADGTKLPSRSWLPQGNPKAIIVAVHGFNDYSHAFETTGQFFKKRGIAVYAYDQRGFGSAPDTGIWGGEQNFVSDLKEYVERLKSRYPHTPVYILGESMGGALAIIAMADPEFPKVQGVILSAPAVWGDGTLNPFYRSTLWVAAHTLPFETLTGNNLKIMASNNIEMLRRLSADPKVIKKTRIDAIYGMVALMDSAYEKTPEVKTPVLLLYGGQDQVIPKQPIDETLHRFNQKVTYVFYPDGYHMLLRDLQGEQVMKDIQSWITRPSAKLPSGYGQLVD